MDSRDKSFLTQSISHAYNLFEVLGLERGSIICAKCNRSVDAQGKKADSVVCHHDGCHHPKVYIFIKWKGHKERFYTGKDGQKFTYDTALKALVSINADINAGRFNPDDWKTPEIEKKRFEHQFAAWLERKEQEAQKGKIAPSTLGNYETYNRQYFSYLKDLDVREIRLKNLQLFYDQLPGSAKYRKNIMDCLRTFFRWLKRWGDIDEVPVWPEMEQPIRAERFALTYEEQQAALQAIPTKHRDIIEFLMETGLRPSEACALMMIDIDVKRRKALIRRTYSESQLRDRVKQKKEYWIVLSDRAWEIVSSNIAMSEFVFTNPDTRRGYRYKVLNRVWNTYCKAGVSLYEGTRHSFCTQLVEDGGSEFQVQEAMRHADRRSTKVYFHPSDERQRELLNRRGKVIDIRKSGDRST